MNRFIRLTPHSERSDVAWLSADKITLIERIAIRGVTRIRADTTELFVDETPEKLIQMIAEATKE